MSKKSVFCIATSRNQADNIVDQLKNANFSNNDISALFADKGTTSHMRSTPKLPKEPSPALSPAVSSAGLWAGSLALAHWPFLEWDRSLRRDRLLPH